MSLFICLLVLSGAFCLFAVRRLYYRADQTFSWTRDSSEKQIVRVVKRYLKSTGWQLFEPWDFSHVRATKNGHELNLVIADASIFSFKLILRDIDELIAANKAKIIILDPRGFAGSVHPTDIPRRVLIVNQANWQNVYELLVSHSLDPEIKEPEVPGDESKVSQYRSLTVNNI